MNNIYLAGPDVFLSNPEDIFAQKKDICAKYGFVGHAPLDNNVNPDAHATPHDFGMDIYYKDMQMMDACDIIVANMTPYHGVGMDGGTAYEMGYMRAQGKWVYGYSNDSTPFIDRQKAQFAHYQDQGGLYRDSTTHMRFIDLDMCDNLMMVGATVETTGADPLVAPDLCRDPVAMHTRMDIFERTIQVIRDRITSS